DGLYTFSRPQLRVALQTGTVSDASRRDTVRCGSSFRGLCLPRAQSAPHTLRAHNGQGTFRSRARHRDRTSTNGLRIRKARTWIVYAITHEHGSTPPSPPFLMAHFCPQ